MRRCCHEATNQTAQKLEKAVEIYPRFAVAWQLLGQVRGELRDTAGARRAFEKALSADPAYARAHLSLARLSLYNEKWADAAAEAQAALDIHKDCPQALYFKGIAKYYSGQPGAAEEAFVRLKQTGFAAVYPVALFHLGVIYLEQEKHAEAVESFEQNKCCESRSLIQAASLRSGLAPRPIGPPTAVAHLVPHRVSDRLASTQQ
jgi:tetratricopeptide (TPR) repeat protein